MSWNLADIYSQAELHPDLSCAVQTRHLDLSHRTIVLLLRVEMNVQSCSLSLISVQLRAWPRASPIDQGSLTVRLGRCRHDW